MRAYFIKHFKGTITEQEEKELLAWIDKSQENRNEYLQERKLWDLILLNSAEEKLSADKQLVSRNRRAKRWIIEISKIAAIFLIAFLTIHTFRNKPEPIKQVWNTIEVPIGQRTSLKLADGTTIWLNAKSKLTFPSFFTGNKREVILDGEAVFKVVHNEKMPFIVKTRKFDLKDLGTEFNVYAYNNSDIFETTLVKGKVQLQNKKTKDSIDLKPNQAAVYSALTNKLILKNVNADESLSWIDGVYSFNNQPLSSIIQRLERYYEVTIYTKDSKILGNRFTGKFRYSDPIEVILEVVKKSNPFKYRRTGNEIIIY